MLPHVYSEAVRVIAAELERQPPDPSIPDTESAKAAAGRGIALIDAGKWKQHDIWVHFPSSWVRQILEMFQRGELSLLKHGL